MTWQRTWRTAARLGVATTVLTMALLGGAARLERSVAAQPAMRVVSTQDVWLFANFMVASEAGTATDITPQLLAAVDADPGATLDLGRGLSFTVGAALRGTAWDSSGGPLSNVALYFGAVTTAQGRVFAAVASPDITAMPRSLDQNSFAGLDLSTVPGVPTATSGTVSYIFQQMLNPADPSMEAGLDDLAIMAQRWNRRQLQQLGAGDGGEEQQPGLTVDAPLTFVTSATIAAAAPGPQDQARTSRTRRQPVGASRERSPAYLASAQAPTFAGWRKFVSTSAPLVTAGNALRALSGQPPVQPVSPRQAAMDNDPQDKGPCDPACTITLDAEGMFTLPEGGAVLQQKVTMRIVGKVGVSTQGMIKNSDGSAENVFTPQGRAQGCQPQAVDADSIPSLTYTAKPVFLLGRLTHSQLRFSVEELDLPRKLHCYGATSGEAHIDWSVDLTGDYEPYSTILRLDVADAVPGGRPGELFWAFMYEVRVKPPLQGNVRIVIVVVREP